MDARLRIAAIASATTLGLAGVVVLGLQALHAGAVLPGVTADGVDLGGMTVTAAAAALDEVGLARSEAAITLEFEDGSQTVQATDFGWDVNAGSAAEAAFAVGRDSNLLGNTWRHLLATFGADVAVPLEATHDEARLAQTLEHVAAQIDQDAGIGQLLADPVTLEVTAVAPARGLVVDRESSSALILAAAMSEGADTVALPVDVMEPTVPMSAVEAAAERAEAALPGGLVLFHGDEPIAPDPDPMGEDETPAEPQVTTRALVELTLTPQQLAGMLAVRADGPDDVKLDARPEEVARVVGEEAARFAIAPINAEFVLDRSPGVTVDGKAAVTWEPKPVSIPVKRSTPGRAFDAELTARQIGDLLEAGESRSRIALREIRADVTIDDARELGITTLLGTFTTYHACCAARVRNIQKLADLVDGTLVAPGEQFSINQISGIRTCASGFFPAGMILNGEIVDSCGGGVSQFGTTTFNAAFFAGLQLDDWKAHSFYISRYPMGREATLNYPSPDIDVKFTNTTDHGLLIRTSYTSTSITVSIYGESDVAKVEATRSGTFAARGWTTQRRANSALAPGQEVRVQSGAGGFSVRVNRFVTTKDGTVKEDEIVTVYSPQREIIEYGPGEPAPQPSPEPSPEPSPAPSAEPTPQPSSSPTPQPSSSPSAEPEPDPVPDPQPQPEPEPEPEPSPSPTGGGTANDGG